MRVSSNKNDPGYALFSESVASGKTVNVFLDDIEISRGCVMADEEAGVVTRCVYGPNGELQVDPSNPDCVWIETASGRVRVEITGGVSDSQLER